MRDAVRLRRHTDEVWHVSFSPDGRALASASKDGSIALYSVAKGVDDADNVDNNPDQYVVQLQAILRGHKEAVSFVAWSGDSGTLLSCSNDNDISLWDVRTGARRAVFKQPPTMSAANNSPSIIGAVCWADHTAQRFVTAASARNITVVRVDDGHAETIPAPGRVSDLASAPAKQRLVALTQERIIVVYKVMPVGVTWPTPTTMRENEAVTSLHLVGDGRHALVSVPHAIRLWDLDAQRRLRSFRGPRQSRFVIRTCVGGAHGAFVASGSEDACVYVWHRASGALIGSLKGHSGVVNAVSWNQHMPGLLASASDDGSVRLWVPSDGQAVELPPLISTSPPPPPTTEPPTPSAAQRMPRRLSARHRRRSTDATDRR